MAYLKGLNKVVNKLINMQHGSANVYAAAATEIALDVLERSGQLVPVDTNTLRLSGTHRLISATNKGADVLVEYPTDYAVTVHEDLFARHKPPRRAKFLEIAMREISPKIE